MVYLLMINLFLRPTELYNIHILKHFYLPIQLQLLKNHKLTNEYNNYKHIFSILSYNQKLSHIHHLHNNHLHAKSFLGYIHNNNENYSLLFLNRFIN